MYRISIGMPAYNCERYIAQSIESLLAQTYGDFELVISDNASTDGTEQICRDYAARDQRIRYVRRTENIGGPGNFRFVFAHMHRRVSTSGRRPMTTVIPSFLERCLASSTATRTQCCAIRRHASSTQRGNPITDYEDNLHLQEDSAVRALHPAAEYDRAV